MLNQLIISYSLLISFICYSIYYYILRRNKFKTAILNISVCSKDTETKYYLMIEIKHGKNMDARKLSKTALLFIPNNSIPLLKQTYNDYESAEKSIIKLKS